MSLTKKSIQIKVDKAGGFVLEAKEGFAGTSCLEQTKTLELVLGGTESDSGKKDSYYDGDSNPISINLDL
jgi:hypothetical protein